MESRRVFFVDQMICNETNASGLVVLDVFFNGWGRKYDKILLWLTTGDS